MNESDRMHDYIKQKGIHQQRLYYKLIVLLWLGTILISVKIHLEWAHSPFIVAAFRSNQYDDECTTVSPLETRFHALVLVFTMRFVHNLFFFLFDFI